MKQQTAILIGTLLILPGCGRSDTDTRTYGDGVSENETVATGAPGSAAEGSGRTPANDAIGSGSTFDTEGASDAEVNSAAAANTAPPASAQAGAQNEAAARTNRIENSAAPVPQP